MRLVSVHSLYKTHITSHAAQHYPGKWVVMSALCGTINSLTCPITSGEEQPAGRDERDVFIAIAQSPFTNITFFFVNNLKLAYLKILFGFVDN